MELANLFTDLKSTKWLIFFSKFIKWIMDIDNDSSERALRVVKLDLDIALRVIKMMAQYLRGRS